jgi:hypothetical protein
MNSTIIGLIAFACSFGGVLTGFLLGRVLPGHHLSEDSKDAVKMGSALIATLTALVLGLLVSSAKTSFDAMNVSLTQSGTNVILLDRALTHYGPEAKDIRDLLRGTLAAAIKKIWPEDKAKVAELDAFEKGPVGMEAVQEKLRQLNPQNDTQRTFKSQALQLSDEMLESRWQTIEQAQISLPMAFLVVVLFWLAVLFITIGLFAPPNPTVISVLLVCTVSVAGAIFLIAEMNRPFEGIMKISSAPLIKALEHIGK